MLCPNLSPNKSERTGKSAQTAIEFFIIVSVVFFLVLLFLSLIVLNIGERQAERKQELAKEVLEQLQTEIDLASSSIDGYEREFSLPATILGENYTIAIDSNYAYLQLSSRTYSLSLSVFNITGQPKAGANTIRKINGSVYLNTLPS
ncbi:hypothetical protein D6817_03960 [Candidatus Pacearchaeota archaeon]|nr:MAG: hypothetical protein D6817_03960 [Candidatus Pacearchaeota archaeon]